MSDIGGFSLWDLFRSEVESHMSAFTESLLAIEGGADPRVPLESAMRAAHSVKGAARVVQLDAGVRLSHAMEDCLVTAQAGMLSLRADDIDVLLGAADLLLTLAVVEESAVTRWVDAQAASLNTLISRLERVREGTTVDEASTAANAPRATPGTVQDAHARAEPTAQEPDAASASAALLPRPPGLDTTSPRPERREHTVKVGAQTLNRLMGLSGDLLVQSRWFEPFSDSLLALKRRQQEMGDLLEALAERLPIGQVDAAGLLAEAREKLALTRQTTTDRYVEFEAFALRSTGLSERLYREVVTTRMRPFGDGVEGLPRLVRDVARQLGKEARLEITGRATEADREILERLDAPLNHCIRNSLDHGLELPSDRVAAGKPPAGTIRLDARHWAGLFVVTVSDDGRGVNIERLRRTIVDRGLASGTVASTLTDAELLEFLFLPGFSTSSVVTDISGRGVGLDAVQEMAKSVGGVARVTSVAGRGLSIRLELPLTLSVVRTLVAEVGGEPFAFPITRIARALMLERNDLAVFAGHHCFTLDGHRIGVVSAHEVLKISSAPAWTGAIPVVLLGDGAERYGLAVDRFVGEFDMVVRPLDPRLGKVQDVSASALMEDGTPVLILDTEDLVRSVATQLQGGRLRGLGEAATRAVRRRRVLVVEDSVTVRELERSLLKGRGYDVEVAVDGMDGWNAVRSGQYDLVVSDVDMPRMTGIELVSRIRADQRLRSLPVIIVSYKDREEDRMKGLDAGADHYMTKNSFQDDTFIRTVLDLIGPSE